MNRFVTTFRLLAFAALLLTADHVCARGCSGVYYLSGTAYAADRSPIKNTLLKISLGDQVQEIWTDENGHYEVKLYWNNPCPSRRTAHQRRQDRKRANPAYVLIRFGEQEVRVKNTWKRYNSCGSSKSKEALTHQKNLHF